MIKLYNPFKPHICKNGHGEFVLRRWFIWWFYFSGFQCTYTSRVDLWDEEFQAYKSKTEEQLLKEYEFVCSVLKKNQARKLEQYEKSRWKKV